MLKRISVSLVSILMLLICSYTVKAAEESFENKYGSISLTLEEKTTNTPVSKAELAIYYVATVALDSNNKLIYTYANEFSDMEHPLDSENLPRLLETYTEEKNIEHRTIITDSEGKAFAGNLQVGLYFIKQINNIEGFAKCTPFIVTLPVGVDESYNFNIEATPKTEIAKLTDITIKKVWNTDENLNPTESVTVQLLLKGEVIETALLNDENNWQITYKNLPESDEYTIKEINVPKDFTDTYVQNGYIFTVTNTSNLIQTGQPFWQIPIFAVAGLLFISIGIVVLRKSRKTNG